MTIVNVDQYTLNIIVTKKCPDCGENIRWTGDPFLNTDTMLVCEWICVECLSSGAAEIYMGGLSGYGERSKLGWSCGNCKTINPNYYSFCGTCGNPWAKELDITFG